MSDLSYISTVWTMERWKLGAQCLRLTWTSDSCGWKRLIQLRQNVSLESGGVSAALKPAGVQARWGYQGIQQVSVGRLRVSEGSVSQRLVLAVTAKTAPCSHTLAQISWRFAQVSWFPRVTSPLYPLPQPAPALPFFFFFYPALLKRANRALAGN